MMRRYLSVLLLLLGCAELARGRTLYVDSVTGTDLRDGLTAQTAKETLPAALELATDGDTIQVGPGTYPPLDITNAIAIISTEGPESTFIVGGYSRCAKLCDGALLGGFTLKDTSVSSSLFGIGLYGGTATNCIITGCKSSRGSGIVYGTSLTNCFIHANTAYGPSVRCSTLYGCTVAGNVNAYSYSSQIGAYDCKIVRSIVYANRLSSDASSNLPQIGGLREESVDCWTNDPHFVCAVHDDFRLRRDSPAVGLGYFHDLVDGYVVSTRVSGSGSVSPAYAVVEKGDSASFAAIEDSRPFLNWSFDGGATVAGESKTFTMVNVRADATLTASFETNLYVDASCTHANPDGYSWATALKTISAAISKASSGETILVAPGSYDYINVPSGKALTIVSTGGADVTFIRGRSQIRCATISNSKTVLRGFTLRNADIWSSYEKVYGGGVTGGTVVDCIITNCYASGGGGAAYNATLVNTLVTGNKYNHGAVLKCTLYHCTVVKNGELDREGWVDATDSELIDSIAGFTYDSYTQTYTVLDYPAVFVAAEYGDFRVRASSEYAGKGCFNGLTVTGAVVRTASNVYSGTVTPEYGVVPPGGSVTFTAANALRPFVGWSLDGTNVVSTSPTYVAQDSQHDLTLTALFGTEIYLDAANGSDTNFGGWASAPLKTLEKALWSFDSGETLHVAPGSYWTDSSYPFPGEGRRIVADEGPEKTRIFVYESESGLNGFDLEGFTLLTPPQRADIGVVFRNGTLRHCILTNALVSSSPLLQNVTAYDSLIARNDGTGDLLSSVKLVGCTVADNVSSGGRTVADGEFCNSIFADNASASALTNVTFASTVTNAPRFICSELGDYRLRPGSAALDAGDNAAVASSLDLRGRARIQNGRVDCGCYEGSDPDLVFRVDIDGPGSVAPLVQVVTPGGTATCVADNATGRFLGWSWDGTNVFSSETTLVVDKLAADRTVTAVYSRDLYVDRSRGNDTNNGFRVAAPFASIQTALDQSLPGDTIHVASGTYSYITVSRSCVSIVATEGPLKTFIDAQKNASCATCYSGCTNSTIVGFTLKNGSSEGHGAGVYNMKVVRCRILDCIAKGHYYTGSGYSAAYGGGACRCTLENCYLEGNLSYSGGHAAYDSTLENCTVCDWSHEYPLENCTAYNTHIVTSERYIDLVGLNSSLSNCCVTTELGHDLGPSGELHLAADSPCRNAGDASFFAGDTDLFGRPRVCEGRIDIGALEYSGETLFTATVDGKGTVSPDGTRSLLPGEVVTFAATGTDREFLGWSTNGVDIVSTDPALVVTNNGVSVTLTARYRKDFYVDVVNGNNANDGTSWEKAKKTMSSAISSTIAGETIYAATGVYASVYCTTPRRIVAVGGPALTTIDAGSDSSCLYVKSMITNVVLEGFTLKRGYSLAEGAVTYYGTLVKCIVTGNSVTKATSSVYSSYNLSGIYGTDVRDSLVVGNSYWTCLARKATFRGCTIADNNDSSYSKRKLLDGCALYNTIATAGQRSRDKVTNLVASVGSWIGNDPHFAKAHSTDYRLLDSSPCLGLGHRDLITSETDLAGNPHPQDAPPNAGCYEGRWGCRVVASVLGSGTVSPSGTHYVEKGGSLTFTAATNAANRAFVGWTTNAFGYLPPTDLLSTNTVLTLSNVCADVTLKAVFDRWLYVSPTGSDSNSGRDAAHPLKSINTALARARAQDDILLAPGTYQELISVDSTRKSIRIIGREGYAATVIDGQNKRRCTSCDSSSSVTFVGLTLANGRSSYGYGGCCYRGTYRNCRITGGQNGDDGGGGVASATLYNCILDENAALVSPAGGVGGGAFLSTLYNCAIVRNRAGSSSGGFYTYDTDDCSWNNVAFDNRAERNAQWYFMGDCRNSVSGDPGFVSARHCDFRLRKGSPGVDAGSDDYVFEDADLLGNPRCQGASVDLGPVEGEYDGFVVEAVWDGRGTTVPTHALVSAGTNLTFRAVPSTRAFLGWSLGADETIVSTDLVYTVSNVTGDVALHARFVRDLYVASGGSIQTVVNSAYDGETIHVPAGVYAPFDTTGKRLTIVADEGPLVTIVDGTYSTRCVTLGVSDGFGRSRLVGFTLRNGRCSDGGTVGAAAWGGYLENCWIFNNANYYGSGGALNLTTATNCSFYGNASYTGEDNVSSTLQECRFDDADYVWAAGGDLRLKTEVSGSLVGACVHGRGTVTPADALLRSGEQVTFTATPTTTRPFLGWSLGETTNIVSAATTFTVTAAASDTVVHAWFAETVYVDPAKGSNANDGLAPERPKATVSAAVSAAYDGESVILAPGVYPPFAISKRRLSIVGSGGWAETFIDGGQSNRCVNLGLSTNTVLVGITLRNGLIASGSGGGAYGGSLVRCRIVDCVSTAEGSSVGGGAAAQSSLDACVVARNAAYGYGSALYDCTARKCTIWGNRACGPVSRASTVYGGTLTDSIVYANEGLDGADDLQSVESANCCLEDPHLVAPEYDDWRLLADSPCGGRNIGAVTNLVEGFVVRAHRIGSRGVLDPGYAIVPSGGAATLAASSERPFRGWRRPGEATVFSTEAKLALANVTSNMTVEAVFDNLIYAAPDGDDANDGFAAGTAKRTIQAAVTACGRGDEIVLRPGSYPAFVCRPGFAPILRSESGASETFVTGSNVTRCAWLGRDVTVCGVTFMNGSSTGDGGGVLGGVITASVISNCVSTSYSYGGGVSDARVYDSLILGNSSPISYGGGGGAYNSTLVGCTVTKNTAYYGGGCYSCSVYNSFVFGNTARDSTSTDAYRNTAFVASQTSETLELGTDVFVDLAADDYRLCRGSGYEDGGADAYVSTATDLLGDARVQGPHVGVGAYETAVDLPAVRVLATGNGTFSCPAWNRVPSGTNFTVTVYSDVRPFRGWTTNGVDVFSTDPELTLENVTGYRFAWALYATNLYVDASRPDDSGDGFSWATAKRSLDAATQLAGPGDTVHVARGAYASATVTAKGVRILSEGTFADTIIDGSNALRCVTFPVGDTTGEIRGFTLTRGRTTSYSRNAGEGGGIRYGRAVGCVISNCYSMLEGGAAYGTHLESCLVLNNRATRMEAGVCGGRAVNCTILGARKEPQYSQSTNGYSTAETECRNCIILGEVHFNNEGDRAEKISNCFFADPCFVCPSRRDYRLSGESPALDVGENAYVTADVDLAGNPRIAGAAVDLGCYEGTPGCPLWITDDLNLGYGEDPAFAAYGKDFTVKSPQGRRIVSWSANGVTTAVDDVSFVLRDVRATMHLELQYARELFVDAVTGDDAATGFWRSQAKRTISAAAGAAVSGDTIHVAPGCYPSFETPDINLRIVSDAGPELTIVDGGGTNRCAYLGAYMSPNVTLVGFTLENGGAAGTDYENGAGVYGGVAVRCIIRNCKGQYGGGADGANLYDCLLVNNWASLRGGGSAYCSAVGCTYVGNKANSTTYTGDSTYYGQLRNSLVWQSGTISKYETSSTSLYHSLVTNTAIFVGASAGDYRLRAGTPAIDAGTNAYVRTSVDLAGNPRIAGAAVDLGCYEGAHAGTLVTVGSCDGIGRCSPLNVLFSNSTADVEFTALTSDRPFLGFTTNGVAVSTAEATFVWRGMKKTDRLVARFQKDLYVDAAAGDDAWSGLTRAQAKRSIAGAVSAAHENETLHVAPGTYAPFDVCGKVLHVVSDAGWRETTIDGGGTNRCANLYVSGQNTASTLEGFRLLNGHLAYGGVSGDGAGTYYGTVERCYYDSCVCESQSCYGGGSCGSVVRNSVFRNCRSPSNGSAAYRGSLTGCTVVDCDEGRDVGSCHLYNTLVWRSGSALPSLTSTSYGYANVNVLTYAGAKGGLAAVRFRDLENGDFRLCAGSVALEAGTNVYVQAGETDLDGNARRIGERVDVGAFEGAQSGLFAYATVSGSGTVTPITHLVQAGESITFTTEPSAPRRFLGFYTNDCLVATEKTVTFERVTADLHVEARYETNLYVNAETGDDGNDGLTAATAKRTLAAGVAIARAGEVVHVAPGRYASIAPSAKEFRIVADGGAYVTFIDGGGTSRCATLSTGNVLEGFTLLNGKAEWGGGASGGTLSRCIVSNCTATAGAVSEATLVSCLVCLNYATERCCGLHFCTAYNCTVLSNPDSAAGRPAYHGAMYNCLYTGAGYSTTFASCWTTSAIESAIDESYHPYSSTSAVGGGDLSYVRGTLDLAGRPRLTDGKVNYGCYEETAEKRRVLFTVLGAGNVSVSPARAGVGETVTFRATETTRPFLGYRVDGCEATTNRVWNWAYRPSAAVTAVFDTNLYVNASAPDDLDLGTSPAHPKRTLAGAFAIACTGDCVRVAAGTYGPFAMPDVPVNVVSADGADVTFVDGGHTNRCVTGRAGRTVSGFTLINGKADCGGGVCGGTLELSVISNCTATASGGGAAEAELVNCLVVRNAAEGDGGGLANGQSWSSTFTENRAGGAGGGVADSTVVNAIVYGNAAATEAESVRSTLTSCTTVDPGFADVSRANWRLMPGSCALSAGNTGARHTSVDLDGSTRIVSGKIDHGCYQGAVPIAIVTLLTDGPGAVSANRLKVPRGSSLTVTATEKGRTFLGFSLGSDTTIVATTRTWTIAELWDDTTIVAWFDRNAYVKGGESIQSAIDAAWNGDTIHLAAGAYAPFDASGRTLEIVGAGVSATVIDGGGTNRCATLASFEEACAVGQDVSLRNVSLVNGAADCGGGFLGGMVENCVISNCTASVRGGGAYGGDLTRGLVVHCAAGEAGGGVWGTTLHHVTLAANAAPAASAAAESAAIDSILAGTSEGGRLENSFAGAADDVGFVSVKYEDWRLAHVSANVGRGYYDGSVPVTLIDVCVGVGHGAVSSDVLWTVADYPVTVTADDSLRPFVGWYDAATNLISTSPTFAIQLQTLNYKLQTLFLFAHFQTNLYLNAQSGDDSFDGFTPATAKRTTAAMADFVLDGESVSVAPGTYAPFALETTNVAFVAAGGYSKTVVTGGVGAPDQSVSFDGFAFGPGAITGGAFAQSTFVETAITNAALTDCSVYGTAADCTLVRSIVWHDDALSNFKLQTSNSYLADPIYADPENGDLRVAEYSPCVTGGVVWCGAVKETAPRPSPPVITPVNGTTFAGSTVVSITSDSPKARIWYTTTGRSPRLTDAFLYKGSFSVTTTVTVKAILKVGRLQSASASATLTLEIPLADSALRFGGFAFEPDGDADWTLVTEDGAPALRSGRIAANGVSSLLFVTNEPGVVSFAWKCDTEEDPTGACTWDNLAVYVDGAAAPFAAIDGATDWQTVKVRLSGKGEHTVLWQYAKDGYDDPDFVTEDAGWLRAFSWKTGDPIPDLGSAPTLAEITDALTGSTDARLLTHISDAAAYNGYRAWAVRLQDERGIEMETVRSHPRAWYSYALGQDALLARDFIEGDLSVKSMDSSATEGITFTLALDDVLIGDGATEENLKRVFGLKATTDLATKSFDAANLTIQCVGATGGCATFVVKPVGTPTSFFLKAEVQP